MKLLGLINHFTNLSQSRLVQRFVLGCLLVGFGFGCAKKKDPEFRPSPSRSGSTQGGGNGGSGVGSGAALETDSVAKADMKCAGEFSVSKQCLVWAWETAPTDSDSGVMLVKIFALNSTSDVYQLAPIDGQLIIKPIMPNMGGHGSGRKTQVHFIRTGVYRVENVFFSMPGDWEIQVQVIKNSGVEDEMALPFLFNP